MSHEGFVNFACWTVDEGNPISYLSAQAPLAGSTWHVSEAVYLDIVTTGSSGVTVNFLNFTNGGWTPVQSSRVLAQAPQVQNYPAVAVNTASHVYAFQDGNVQEFQLAPGKAHLGVFGVNELFRSGVSMHAPGLTCAFRLQHCSWNCPLT